MGCCSAKPSAPVLHDYTPTSTDDPRVVRLDREIARIRRIQTLQQRGVALSGTAIASAMISLGTLAARVAYTYIFCTEGEPCNA